MKRLLVLSTLLVVIASTALAQVQPSTYGLTQYRNTSATATQLQVVFDLAQAHDTVAISAACSAGTASLTVDASVDNTNFLTLDSIGAAATNIKQYTATTVGAAIALSPLSFRYLRLTVASCGASNTSTLTVAAK